SITSASSRPHFGHTVNGYPFVQAQAKLEECFEGNEPKLFTECIEKENCDNSAYKNLVSSILHELSCQDMLRDYEVYADAVKAGKDLSRLVYPHNSSTHLGGDVFSVCTEKSNGYWGGCWNCCWIGCGCGEQ
ncbi:MAG: hypothetical protein ACPGUV_12630, partial [Polyangiales bacterium]